jgi:HAD superfamily hydrolase (TIGR01549 family)
MTVLFPNFDYDAYARDFVESQGFEYSSIENQRNNHLAVSEFLNTISQLAVVGKDIAQNSWLKILDGILRQKLVAGERGSSTMSHKINPWRLENAESLFEQALGLASRASEGLVASRHERDLSDHDWQRAFGDILGRVVVGYDYFAIQLDRLTVDKELAQKALAGSAEVLSELVQTAGRVSGDPEAYDRVVELTQGRQLDGLGIKGVIEEALPTGDLRNRVLAVTSETYTGVAAEKAREAVVGWHAAKGIVRRGLLDESTSVDAVLFDFDNTLHFGDKDELFARLSAIAEQLGSGFTEEEIREFGNRSDYLEMRKLMVEEHNRRLGAGIAEDDFQAANDLVTGQFDHLLKPAPNAVEILGQLRDSGKKVGLVTTRGNKSRDRLLKHHGMFDSFDIIVGRGDAERRKPHPHPLVLALDGLGISTDLTRRVLFVGDSQIEDIGAGNALSMKTALVNQVPLDRFGPRPTHHWTSLEPLARRYTR